MSGFFALTGLTLITVKPEQIPVVRFGILENTQRISEDVPKKFSQKNWDFRKLKKVSLKQFCFKRHLAFFVGHAENSTNQ